MYKVWDTSEFGYELQYIFMELNKLFSKHGIIFAVYFTKNNNYNNACIEFENIESSVNIAMVLSTGIFYLLPLLKSQITSKINDSLSAFQIYFISLLLCINNMIKQYLILYPNQIDTWIIPKNITQILDDDDGFSDEINKDFDLNNGLKYCNNLQQLNLFYETDLNLDKLFQIFENHKRMCVIRRDHKQSKSVTKYMLIWLKIHQIYQMKNFYMNQ